MAWNRRVDKPLPEPMMTQIDDLSQDLNECNKPRCGTDRLLERHTIKNATKEKKVIGHQLNGALLFNVTFNDRWERHKRAPRTRWFWPLLNVLAGRVHRCDLNLVVTVPADGLLGISGYAQVTSVKIHMAHADGGTNRLHETLVSGHVAVKWYR